MLSGPDASYFAISNTGQLVFQDFPDYEFRSSFSLTITVSDGSLSDSINLNIEILDISYVIDLLVYYAPDMLSFHGSESAVRTKVLYLITSANSALNRSKAEIQFNLLKLLPYDVDVANQSNDDIFSSLVEREKIKRDQVLYGADYFILLSDGIMQKSIKREVQLEAPLTLILILMKMIGTQPMDIYLLGLLIQIGTK